MVLQPDQLAMILEQAERAAPEECCGVLIGTGGRVASVVAAANVAEGERERRYSIDVQTLLAAHQHARAHGLEVLGYYHSHPEGTAHPSAFDLEHALPNATYVIVALSAGRAIEARGWQLRDGVFGEEPLEIHTA